MMKTFAAALLLAHASAQLGGGVDDHGCMLSAGYSCKDELREQKLKDLDARADHAPADPADCTELADCPRCVSWYDGCNTCRVAGGVVGGCTMMLCPDVRDAHCLAYEEEETADGRRRALKAGAANEGMK